MKYLKQNTLIHHFKLQIGQKYNSQQKKYLSENLWLNSGEKQRIPSYLKVTCRSSHQVQNLSK